LGVQEKSEGNAMRIVRETRQHRDKLLQLMRLNVMSLQLALDLQMIERRGPTPAKSASGKAQQRPVLLARAG
jgi:hypothetical protein